MLHQPPIDNKYYFAYAGKFETDNSMRGFNCITYIGAVYGVYAYDATTRIKPMGGYGTGLAKHLGATPCSMEAKKEAAIKEFFKTNITGAYIMWSSGHSVLVVDGNIHEFSESKGGYAKTSAESWNYHGKTYWVRKLSGDS